MKQKIIAKTPIGPVAIIWKELNGTAKVEEIILSRPQVSAEKRAKSLYPDIQKSSCKKIDSLAENILTFLQGKNVKFSLDILNWEQCTDFQKAVLFADHKIPKGKVDTYQGLAKQIGKPKAARAVGNALGANPFPLVIPCHRVIATDGKLGGFQSGLRIKKILLQNEGVTFAS